MASDVALSGLARALRTLFAVAFNGPAPAAMSLISACNSSARIAEAVFDLCLNQDKTGTLSQIFFDIDSIESEMTGRVSTSPASCWAISDPIVGSILRIITWSASERVFARRPKSDETI